MFISQIPLECRSTT
ncbi:hypothetical protein LINPERHAP1_LOCUS22419 [Linum perenne]